MVHHCIVIADGPDPFVRLCGISVLERLLRTVQRCGVTSLKVLSDSPELLTENLGPPSWARPDLNIEICNQSSNPLTAANISIIWPHGLDNALVLKGDSVLDIRLLRLLLAQRQTTALVDSGAPSETAALVHSAPATSLGKFCGAALIQREWLASQNGELEAALFNGLNERTVVAVDVAAQPLYYGDMRRELRPLWFPAPSSSNCKLAERILLDSTQKGALDLPAWFHAPIEKFLISRICRTRITPNQLTFFCNVVAWTATLLFVTGHLIVGIILALIVGVLDGLDGKQARIKVETTKRGKLEHWFDGIFEWSWWTALAYYFKTSGLLPGAFLYLFLLVVAEAVDALAKGSVLFATGKLIDELSPFERFVRLIGGRRNVYIWILVIALLLGVPAKGFVAMVWLEVGTALVHLPRVAWVFWSRNRKQTARSN